MCRFDHDPAGRLWHVSYSKAEDRSETTWTFDMDRVVEIREDVRDSDTVDDIVWRFGPDEVTQVKRNDWDFLFMAEFGLEGFSFIGSPYQCDRALISSETLLRLTYPDEDRDVSVDYSYEGSFESGTRVGTGVDASSGAVFSTATFEYDDAERLIHEIEEQFEVFIYTVERTIERNEAGRISEQRVTTNYQNASPSTVVRSYRYDEFGNVLAVHLTTSSSGDEFEYDLTYTYDCW